MKRRWSGLRPPSVPSEVAAAIGAAPGESLLAWALEAATGTTVVAGRHRLYAVRTTSEGATLTLERPWHLVDSGTWSGEDGLLTITWVDGQPDTRFALTQPGMLPETLRERVQASVVIAETIDLPGRGKAKVVVRTVLETRELVSQAVLGRGVRGTDPGVAEQVAAGLARVREQVGLD